MAQDFWTTNLNSHTMFVNSAVTPKREANKKKQKGSYLKNDELEGYVSANSLREAFGFSTKKMKAVFALFGDEPRYNQGCTYYPTQNLEKAKELLLEKKEPVDMSNYITNQELMKMFNFDTNKAFYVADHEKLVKKRFGGNVNYYEREKAIEAFSKYKK